MSFVQIMRQKSESPIVAFVTGNRRGFHNAEKCFVGPLLSRKLVGREVQIFQFIARQSERIAMSNLELWFALVAKHTLFEVSVQLSSPIIQERSALWSVVR